MKLFLTSGPESKLFTGDTSKDNQNLSLWELVLTREVNLVFESSALSEAEIRESVREFQPLIVWGKKLDS